MTKDELVNSLQKRDPLLANAVSNMVVDDVLDGGLVVAFFGEQLFRGGEDAAFRHLGVRVACHGSSFRYVISIHTDSRYVYCVS